MLARSVWIRCVGVGLALSLPLLAGCGLFVAQRPDASGATIGVNAFLWRASLDTFSFMPLKSADPWGGIINTEWHSDAQRPDERFKATIYILDTRLRADAVSVTLFRQTKGEDGQWKTASVSPDTTYALVGAILQRARQLRQSMAGA